MIVRWRILGVTCLLYFVVQGATLDKNITEIVNNTLADDNVLQSAISVNDLADKDEGDSEAAARTRRRPDIADIIKIDASTLSDSTNEERGARCSLSSKRRLSKADNSDKVASYFMNGGPTLGHAYFFNNGAQCDTSAAENAPVSSVNDGSGIVGAANPMNAANPINSAPSHAIPMQLTPIFAIPGPPPYAPNAYYPSSQNFYNPITGVSNPLSQNTVDNTFSNGILGSILHPQNLGRTTGNLLQGLVGIPSMVHNWVTQNLVGYAPENTNASNGNYEKQWSDTPVTSNSDAKSLPRSNNYNLKSSANAQDNIVGNSLNRGTKSTRSRERLSQRRKDLAASQYTPQYTPLLGLANPQPAGYIILPHNPYLPSTNNMVGAPYQPTSCQRNDNNQNVGAEKPSTEEKSVSVPSDETNLDQEKDSPVIQAPKDGTESAESSTNTKNKDASCNEK